MASSLSSGHPNALAGIGDKASALGAAGGGQFYDCVRFCAMFDKPYIARYERKAGQPFQLVGTFTDAVTAGAGNGKRSSVIIPMDLIRSQTHEERCSWCGKKGKLVKCVGGCGEIICAASVTETERGEYFRCRKSCGVEGWVSKNRIQTQACEISKKAASSKTFPSSGGLDRVGLPGQGGATTLVPGRLRLKS
jgi:hypothetical protein